MAHYHGILPSEKSGVERESEGLTGIDRDTVLEKILAQKEMIW